MKKSSICLVGMVTLLVVCICHVALVEPQEMAPLEVTDDAICLKVENLECLDANTRFDPSVGTLFCLTRINGAQGSTYVTHVWHFGDEERARVRLDVHSSSWRTYSSKIILPQQIGEWHVDVLGLEDELLKRLQFEIAP